MGLRPTSRWSVEGTYLRVGEVIVDDEIQALRPGLWNVRICRTSNQSVRFYANPRVKPRNVRGSLKGGNWKA